MSRWDRPASERAAGELRRARRHCPGRRSTGCRSEMYEQPRYEPLEPSAFFEDGSSSRPLVAGTVPRDDPRGGPPAGVPEEVFYTGWSQGKLAETVPFPVDRRGPRARAGTLPDLLHTLPRRARGRPGHDRPARLQSAASVCQRRAAEAADRPLLRRDDAAGTGPCIPTPRGFRRATVGPSRPTSGCFS